MNMNVNIAGVEWKNPVTVASGTFGSGAEYSEFVDLNNLWCSRDKRRGKCAVAWKSYTPCSRDHRRNAECYRSSESWNRCFL